MGIISRYRKFEQKFDRQTEWFLWHHPIAGFLFVFVGLPLFVLVCVGVGTAIISLPIAWICGWI